jgi:hypothetical protein
VDFICACLGIYLGRYAKATCSEKIYFDGALPTEKRGVRRSRLETNLKQLVAFHARNKDFRAAQEHTGDNLPTLDELFDFARPVPANFKSCPVPFLVPAALERLAGSHYADVVHVVPGEADLFCATASRRSGGMILTGDSDLLAYDLGSEGGVLFFDQLELKVHDMSLEDRCVHAKLAVPHDIAARLKVGSLQRLAFELREDPYIGILEAARRSRLALGTYQKRCSYQQFIDEYAEDVSVFNDRDGTSSVDVSSSSPLLDPRLSELVVQWNGLQKDDLHMYLPFLIEDPTRAAAWSVSADLRSLAYSVLMQDPPRDQTPAVWEYSRRDIRIVSSGITILKSLAIAQEIENLNEKLAARRKQIDTHSPVVRWRTFGMIDVFKWYIENDRTLPSRSTCLKVLYEINKNTVNWEDIHLSAQLQAALYSYRLLKQVKDLAVFRNLQHSRTTGTVSSELFLPLSDLPHLSELIPSQDEEIHSAATGSDIGKVYDFIVKSAQPNFCEEPAVEDNGARAHIPTPTAPIDKQEMAWTTVGTKQKKRQRKDKVIGKAQPVVKIPSNHA